MSSRKSLGLLLVAFLFSNASAFIVVSSGPCPNIPVQQTFDLNRYMGLWFSYENFDAPFQFATTCVSALYSLRPDGNVRVVNFGFRDFQVFGRSVWRSPTRIVGMATIPDRSQPAGLNVQFGGQPDFTGDNSGPNYKIIATDYDNYSLVYSCSRLPWVPLKIEFAWILTRRRGERPANIDQLKNILRGYEVDTDNFKPVDHSNCS